jgi:hypothetical protein
MNLKVDKNCNCDIVLALGLVRKINYSKIQYVRVAMTFVVRGSYIHFENAHLGALAGESLLELSVRLSGLASEPGLASVV